MRGVPFDRPAQELRRQDRSLRHHLGGDQRGLRGLSRPGLEPRRLGARPEERWPFGKREDPDKGLPVRFDERRDVTWPIDPQTGTARRSHRAGSACARRSRPADCATRAAPASTRTGCPASRCRRPMWSNRSRATPIMPTARSATSRSRIIIRRSSRARCSPPASPAAIATSRTARNFASPAKASACNAMQPTNTPTPGIVTTPVSIRRRPASRATCRPAPTWSSILATITASASPGPIFR